MAAILRASRPRGLLRSCVLLGLARPILTNDARPQQLRTATTTTTEKPAAEAATAPNSVQGLAAFAWEQQRVHICAQAALSGLCVFTTLGCTHSFGATA